jgi:nicotinamidase-related amidase
MRKVLIVVDMQNDFVHGVLGSAEARAIVPNVVEKIRSAGIEDKVILTRDTHYADYMNSLEGKYLPVEHCVKGTEGWQIIPELLDLEANGVVNKYTFGYRDWPEFFEFEDIDELEFELCGVCTDICVVSNALALRMFYPDVKITVDASCCAGVTPEKHKAALEVMKSCQIEVINE